MSHDLLIADPTRVALMELFSEYFFNGANLMTHTDRQIQPTTRLPILPLLIFAALVVGSATISACSTTEGFGEDVKHLGSNIEDSAAKNK